MSASPVTLERPPTSTSWLREVNKTQWNAFFAAFLGWTLDAFDFTIVSFLLVDIQNSFSVSKTLLGTIGSVTLFCRVIGGIGAGTAADRWGRKAPLMFSILWFSAFAFLSGLSTSFRMLLLLRALFGIGMGGVWAAGMPLALEHWPARLRGVASGMLQAGYSTGFIISALVFQFGYPLVNTRPDFAWRVMFAIGVVPALLVFYIVSQVKESPVWLERQRHLRDTKTREAVSLTLLFRRNIIGTTLGTSLMMTMFIFSYYSITFWYAPFIIGKGLKPVSFSLLLNIGGQPSRGASDRDDAHRDRGRTVVRPRRQRVVDVARRIPGRLLCRRLMGHGAELPERALPDRRPRGRRRLRLPRRGRARLVHADHHRGATGPRHGPWLCDGSVDRARRHPRDRHGLDGPGNPRPAVPGS